MTKYENVQLNQKQKHNIQKTLYWAEDNDIVMSVNLSYFLD